jgi:hypothetical protein
LLLQGAHNASTADSASYAANASDGRVWRVRPATAAAAAAAAAAAGYFSVQLPGLVSRSMKSVCDARVCLEWITPVRIVHLCADKHHHKKS